MALSAPGDGNESDDPTTQGLLGSWNTSAAGDDVTAVEYELYEDGSSLGIRGEALTSTTEFSSYGPDPNAAFEADSGSTYKFRVRFSNSEGSGPWSSFSNNITIN
jgi:hypothetical protein